MNISFIGSGNVAHHLMQAFDKAGHSIEEIFSRNIEQAAIYANRYKANLRTDLQNFAAESDLIILSISDDAIPTLAEQLKMFNTPVVHTAGSVNIQVLSSTRHSYGVLYPLQTFSKEKEIDYSQIPYFIESSDDILTRKLEDLITSTQATFKYLNSEQRMQLHIAAVFACNFSNFMFDLAAQLLHKQDIPFSSLMPLIQECIQKLEHLSPEQAQTGPAKRGDNSTMQKHMKALESQPELQKIYELLSREIEKKHNQS